MSVLWLTAKGFMLVWDSSFNEADMIKIVGITALCLISFFSCKSPKDMSDIIANEYKKYGEAECGNFCIGSECKELGDCEDGFSCEQNKCIAYGDIDNINDSDTLDDDFDYSDEEPWTDPDTQIQWSKISERMNSSDAYEYCAHLEENGYVDWQVPSISVLRTLIKNCAATITGGECGVYNGCPGYTVCWNDACDGDDSFTDGRYSKLEDPYPTDCWNDACDGCDSFTDGRYSKLEDAEELWSSTSYISGNNANHFVDFRKASIYSRYNEDSIFVRCFRGLENDLIDPIPDSDVDSDSNNMPDDNGNITPDDDSNVAPDPDMDDGDGGSHSLSIFGIDLLFLVNVRPAQ